MTESLYTLDKEVNILENEKLAIKLNILALIFFVLFLPVFWLISKQIAPIQQMNFFNHLGFFKILLPLVFFFIIIVIHELTHGIFMKLFNPKGKVIFGFKNGMAFAASPGSRFSRAHFFWISLSPFVLLTSTMIGFYYFGLINPSVFISITSMHAGACIGDFYWGLLIIQAPKKSLIEDTDVGIKIYKKH